LLVERRKLGAISSPVVRQRLQGPDMPGRTLEAASIVFHCMTISNMKGCFPGVSYPLVFLSPSKPASLSPSSLLRASRFVALVRQRCVAWRFGGCGTRRRSVWRPVLIVRKDCKTPESRRRHPFAIFAAHRQKVGKQGTADATGRNRSRRREEKGKGTGRKPRSIPPPRWEVFCASPKLLRQIQQRHGGGWTVDGQNSESDPVFFS
jgi:hypothetical protein